MDAHDRPKSMFEIQPSLLAIASTMHGDRRPRNVPELTPYLKRLHAIGETLDGPGAFRGAAAIAG
jgi:hypothetical protein